MKELAEKAKELGLIAYQPCEEHDALLLLWWKGLLETEEFDRVLPRRAHKLSSFFQVFQPPTFAMFAHDEDNRIWIAAWFDLFSDIDSGVFMHFWGREDMRHTREGILATHIIYDFATRTWPVVVGVTKHEDLLRIHRKVGYNIVGSIPKMLDGVDAWILYLTRELYTDSKFYKTGEKINGWRKNKFSGTDAPRDEASDSGVLVGDRAAS